MATEEIIVRAVRLGADRQEVHEVIRRHAVDAARAVKGGAARNDLLERLAADAAFSALGVSLRDLEAAVDPARFVGRAPQQVDEFLLDVVEPILARHAGSAARVEEVRV
jgi:adenylosuccinate lyase